MKMFELQFHGKICFPNYNYLTCFHFSMKLPVPAFDADYVAKKAVSAILRNEMAVTISSEMVLLSWVYKILPLFLRHRLSTLIYNLALPKSKRTVINDIFHKYHNKE